MSTTRGQVMADNKDCPKCEGTGTVGPDLGHQVPCDATGNDNDGMDWYCADGTVRRWIEEGVSA